MSDWRNGNNKDSGGRKENRSTAKPIIPTVSNPKVSSSTPSGSSSDWRTNSKKRVISNKPVEKSWTGRGREKTTSTTALAKALLLAGVGLVVSSLFYVLWVELFRHDPRLPVVVGISTDYSTMDLSSNSFSVTSFDFKKDKLLLFPGDQKSPKGDPLKLAGHETFLNAIRKEEEWVPSGQDWEKIKNFQNRQRSNLVGGGPSEKVTAYFISCLIAREGAPEVTSVISGNDSEKVSWKLLTKDDSPFRESKDPLSVKTLLKRIAKQTAKNSYAYVALDVKPPPVVTNLGDLEFPFEDLERAFTDLDDELKQRLIVCLPCSKGEESWVAPEYSSSVFAHFFWQGITNGFDGSQISISKFQEALERNVTNWVAERRFAKQTPSCIALDDTKTQMKKVMFVEKSGGELKSQEAATVETFLPKRCETLQKLWAEYENLRHCVYTNPLRFATVESGLIQMEDLAEYASPQAWKDFEDRITMHLDDLKKLTKFERRVSLVETEQHQNFIGKSSVFSDPNDQKCLETWKSLIEATKNGGVQGFSKKDLEEAIKKCQLDPEQWIEVRLLKLMHEAIRDIDDNSAAQKAIARLLKMYSELNSIAFDPRSELSHWMGKRVVDLDKHFAEGFDYFFANDFKVCHEKLDRVQPELAKMSADFKTLKEAMIARDETLWLTPHLLAAQMRMSRLPSYQESKSVSEIAALLQSAILLCNSLDDDQKEVGSLNLKPGTVTEQLEKLKASLDSAFLDASTKQEGDARLLPMTRIALRWPLLKTGLRKTLHDRLVKFYAKGNTKSDTSTTVDGKWSSMTPSDVGKDFWSQSKLQDNKTLGSLYDRMIKNDARYAVSQKKKEADQDRVDGSATAKQAKQRIYRESCQMRMFANAVGQLSLEDFPKQELWPLNAPDQLQAVNEVVYSHVQCERLCTTRWGDGDLNTKKQLYFERLVSEFSKMFNADAALALKESTQAQSIPKELEKSSEEFLKIARKQVKDLSVEAGRLDSSQVAPVSIEIGKNEWPVLATLSVHADSPIGSRLPFSGLQKTNSKGQKLSQEATQVSLRLDPKRAEGELRLGVRGHYKSSPLLSSAAAKKFKVMQESLLGPTKLRIKANDNKAIKLWVLLDCSYSMYKNNLHKEAIGTAKQLLGQVMKLNDDGESPIDVGLIIFGHKAGDKPHRRPSILEPCPIGNQIFKSPVMKGKDIGELVNLLDDDWVIPSGCTPLYDAIYTACEPSEKDGRNWIVVISDGSNDIAKLPPGKKKEDADYYWYYETKAGDKKDVDIRQKVIDSNSKLFVFQFLNNDYYKEERNQDGSETFDTQKVKQIESSNRELQALITNLPSENAGNLKSGIFYDDFNKLKDDIIARLPVSKITITAPDGSKLGSEEFYRFGKQIAIQVPEPMEATVTVDSRNKVSKFPIWLAGGEKLEFKYSDSGRLTMTPYREDVTSSYKPSKLMLNENGVESLVGARAAIAAVDQDSLDVQLVLQNDSKEWLDHTKLIRRPGFVVASVSPAGSQEEAFWACDHAFVPETHYPNIQLPYIPWKKEDNQFRSEKLDLKVWISEVVPPKAITFQMKKNDKPKEIKELRLSCERVKDVVTVTVPESLPEKGRHLVMCTTAIKTTRHYVGEYSDGREVKIEFEVPRDKDANICIFKASELEVWRNTGAVQRFDVQDLEFIK